MSVDPTPSTPAPVLSPFEEAVHRATARLAGQQITASGLMLFALKRSRRPIYAGTVPAHVKARRRAANKRARVARRAARR